MNRLRKRQKPILVTVRMVDILRSNNPMAWEQFCSKYGINEWCFNEGRADDSDTVQITEKEKNIWVKT